jgi:uncharacterized membrane protein YfcA
MDLSIGVLGLLILTSFIAGVIDTLAGGGGLITVPALLLSGVNPLLALGTDKLQSAIGEFSATIHFLKHGRVNYRRLSYGIVCTMIGAIIGTISLQYMPIHKLEKLIPILLLSMLIYYLVSNRKIHYETHETINRSSHKFFLLFGISIGFYNGFFGPGTGTLWAISLMRFLHLSIKKATMYTKPLNLVANIAAIVIFLFHRQIDFKLALLMGFGSFIGGKYGAKLVIHKNSRWLKTIFVLLMAGSTAGTFIKYYF